MNPVFNTSILSERGNLNRIMNLVRIVILGFVLSPFNIIARSSEQDLTLTDSSVISLITISPGRELDSRFGHSAIRVHDPNLKLDVAFNYGTFDFNTPGFYLKFLRGKLLYFVNAERFDQMYHVYMRMNRSLKEQQLNLTLKERQEVFKFLIINYKPENRYYLYDFFFDNCSSRIRDVFKNILGSRLEFEEYTNDNRSFR